MPLSNPAATISTDGWTDDSATTWTYASATTFTVAGVDVTAKFSKGTRLKLTQTTVKYFVVVGSSFSTDTTVTITGGTDYTLANAAISANYYSYATCPQGYPNAFAYTPSYTGFSSPPANAAYFQVVGSICTLIHTFTDGTSNATGFTISLPVTVVLGGYIACRQKNNGNINAAPGMVEFSSGTTLTIYTSWIGGAWTNTNAKAAGFVASYVI